VSVCPSPKGEGMESAFVLFDEQVWVSNAMLVSGSVGVSPLGETGEGF